MSSPLATPGEAHSSASPPLTAKNANTHTAHSPEPTDAISSKSSSASKLEGFQRSETPVKQSANKQPTVLSGDSVSPPPRVSKASEAKSTAATSYGVTTTPSGLTLPAPSATLAAPTPVHKATTPNKKKKDPAPETASLPRSESALSTTTALPLESNRPTSPPKAIRQNSSKSFTRSPSALASDSTAISRDQPPTHSSSHTTGTLPTIVPITTALEASSALGAPLSNFAQVSGNASAPIAPADDLPKKKSGSKKRKSIKEGTVFDLERDQSPLARALSDEKITPPTEHLPTSTTSPALVAPVANAEVEANAETSPAVPKIRKSTSSNFKDSIVSLISIPGKKKAKKGDESDGEREDKIVSREGKDAAEKEKDKEKDKEKERNDKDGKDKDKDAKDKEKDAKDKEKDAKEKEKDAKDGSRSKDSKLAKEKDSKEKDASKDKDAMKSSTSDLITSASSSTLSTSSSAVSVTHSVSTPTVTFAKKPKKLKKKVGAKKKPVKVVCYLQTVPLEILLKMLCCLDVASLIQFATTSKLFRSIGQEAFVWHVVAVKMMRAGQRKPRIFEWQSYCKSMWCFRRGLSLDIEASVEVPLGRDMMEMVETANSRIRAYHRHLAASTSTADPEDPSSTTLTQLSQAPSSSSAPAGSSHAVPLPMSLEQYRARFKRSDSGDSTATGKHARVGSDNVSNSEDVPEPSLTPERRASPLPYASSGSLGGIDLYVSHLLDILKDSGPEPSADLSLHYPFLFTEEENLEIRLSATLPNTFKIKQTLTSSPHLVQRAIHLPSREMVTIVKVPYIPGMKPPLRRRELQMARWMQTTDFPFLVSYYGIYFDGRVLSYVSEYCTGGSCRQQLDGTGYTSFTESEIALVARDVLRALAMLHSRGFVHGNVSASSIMISELRQGKSIVKLRMKTLLNSLEAAARSASSSSSSHTPFVHPALLQPSSTPLGMTSVPPGLNTPSFESSAPVVPRSPELASPDTKGSSEPLLKDPPSASSSTTAEPSSPHSTFIGSQARKAYWRAPESTISPAMDIWSLGITLIELAEGRPPCWNLPPAKARASIVNSPPPSLRHPTSFSAKFRAFLDSCLVKDPKGRPTAAQLLTHPFIVDNAQFGPKKLIPGTSATPGSTAPATGRAKLTRFNSSPAPTSAIVRTRTRKAAGGNGANSAAEKTGEIAGGNGNPSATTRRGRAKKTKNLEKSDAGSAAGSSAAGSSNQNGRPQKISRRLSYAGSASTSDTHTHPYLSDSEDNISFALTHSSSRLSFSWSEDWASGSVDVSIDSKH